MLFDCVVTRCSGKNLTVDVTSERDSGAGGMLSRDPSLGGVARIAVVALVKQVHR